MNYSTDYGNYSYDASGFGDDMGGGEGGWTEEDFYSDDEWGSNGFGPEGLNHKIKKVLTTYIFPMLLVLGTIGNMFSVVVLHSLGKKVRMMLLSCCLLYLYFTFEGAFKPRLSSGCVIALQILIFLYI